MIFVFLVFSTVSVEGADGIKAIESLESMFGCIEQDTCGSMACGACCAAQNRKVSRKELLERLPRHGKLSSMRELAEVMKSFGFTTTTLKWKTLPWIVRFAPGVILIRKDNRPHFVSVVGFQDGLAVIVDHPSLRLVAEEDLREKYEWTGEVMHISHGWRTCLLSMYLHLQQVAVIMLALLSVYYFLRKMFLMRRDLSTKSFRVL